MTIARSVLERMDVAGTDITTLALDAIVNAANEGLTDGAGVCGAIHRAAGPRLLERCLKLRGCPTGEARITEGYNLLAGYVIHAVGPVWRGGNDDEDALLASCYRRALGLAAAHGLGHIAFPAISTGNFGFPAERAAKIAMRTVADFLSENATPARVTFCAYGPSSMAILKGALAALTQGEMQDAETEKRPD
ncbi:macro domain-containing protein [Varunaivibrio sulfuroxidans]|uniref:O-acetyl-ADP-ribose deacetylase (Regulator of RNase III) n=1 Tax=Varunaivibrio sulfuroxidans TaxID=1773489 RepID=A0A4R3JHT6_9PROT|nr:macro domain-containing protein [Varunaivibrio sulfuroxidans]TCS64923.1 O-acetyl-ADP-ribose deacetylase (regulator of RNase III) [Varunaivibrio sulfuroxidans]WES29783.1 macro domain-containing protein [Varunaivibrio sulfuroxidans]